MLLSEKNKSSLLVADHQYHESKNARALPVVLLGTAKEEWWVEWNCPRKLTGSGTTLRYGLVGGHVSLWRWVLRSHMCSNHSQCSLPVACTRQNFQLPLWYHICLHAATVTRHDGNGLNPSELLAIQWNVFLYESHYCHTHRDPNRKKKKTYHFS